MKYNRMMKKSSWIVLLLLLFVQTTVFAGNNDVILNLKNGKYHKPECEYALHIKNAKTINKPLLNIKYKPSGCCYPEAVKPQKLKEPSIVFKHKENKMLAKLEKEEISLFFVNPVGVKKPQNKCLNDVCLSLVTLIDNSEKTIDMAVYGFQGQDEIINALRRAKQRGVVIRGTIDDHGAEIYRDSERLAAEFNMRYDKYSPIAEEKYKIDEKRSKSALHHNKFFIVDNKWVFTGSTNISDSCMTYNSNNAITIFSPELAQIYTTEFEQMYVSGRFHEEKLPSENNKDMKINDNTVISVYFSPQDSAILRGLLPRIKNAKKSINIAMFYLTNKWVIDEIIAAHQRGVEVRIILDMTLTQEPQNPIQRLIEAGVPTKLENWNGKMHQKTAVIDDIEVILGSTNWTRTAELVSDENMLIISSKKLAKTQNNEFERLWKSIPEQYFVKNFDLSGIKQRQY